MGIVGLALILALCIPIVTILSDGPIGKSIADRLSRSKGTPPAEDDAIDDQEKRLRLLEGDVEMLQHAVDELREENEFLRRLLEDGRPGTSLPPGGA